MRRSAAIFASLLVLSGAMTWAQTCTLATATTAATSGNQHVFDLVNLTANRVRVTRIDSFLTTGAGDVQIWMVTCGGTQVGKTNQPGLWTQVANFPGVVGLGTAGITVLPNLPSPIDLPPGPTGVYIFRTTGSTNYDSTVANPVGTSLYNDGILEIQSGFAIGTNFPAALPTLGRNWRGAVHYDCMSPGPPTPSDYQLNQPGAGFVIDGVSGGACSPTVVTKSTFSCTPVAPATGTIAISSNLIAFPWDVAISGSTLLPASGGGLTLPDGQVINVNIGMPLSFLNGFLGANWPGFGIPGVTTSTLSFGYSLTTQTDFAFQAFFVDPSAGSGIRLSQAAELHVNVTAPSTSVPITLADNATFSLNITTAPNCWATGIPFFGTNHSIMHILSNGRVMFGAAGNTTAAPTVALFASNNPSVGLWTDLNPALAGGAVTATNVGGGIIRVDYAVRYAAELAGPLNTYGIEFDVVNGTVKIDGLMGVLPNPQGTGGGVFSATADSMLLGISRGNTGATTPAATTFTNMGGGLAANATDMWYDFYAAVNPGQGLCNSLVGAPLTSITFTPSVTFAPNYDWSGM